jgi:SAM-dependent methyltransferase
MTACTACVHLVADRCGLEQRSQTVLHRELAPAPLSTCQIAIVDHYCELIAPGMKVLEIGCGSWSPIKERCREVGATYDGIDATATYYGEPTVATRVENLRELSFDDEAFDLVIGTQSMEHWDEFGCPLEWGVYQCFRVLKPGGSLWMNVPIHFHGSAPFLMGDLGAISATLWPYANEVTLEPWGSPPVSGTTHFAHPSFPPLRQRAAYILDVRAVKVRMANPPAKRSGPSGPVGRFRALPVTFAVHRVGVRSVSALRARITRR